MLEDFGPLLRRLLEKHHLSVYQLGKETGLSNGLLYKYLNGDNRPNYSNLIILQQFFQCDWSELFPPPSTPAS